MKTDNKIKVSELQAGDILLIEPCDELISKLIAKVTKSPVSHTALSCGKSDDIGSVMEETPPVAVRSTVLNRTERTAYVMRLNSNIKCDAVMDIAAKYVLEELPYANAQLPFIALYCLISDFTEGDKLQGLIKRIVRLALGVIVEIQDKHRYEGKNAMMCSQFAYHCYREAGKEYKINMNDEVIYTLINKIIDIISKEPQIAIESEKYVLDNEYEEDINNQDKLLDELCREIDDARKNNVQSNKKKPDVDFIKVVCQFAKKFVMFYGEGIDDSKDMKYYLEKLMEMKEYFISPGDLLNNTQNLVCVGTVDYEGYHKGL